MPLYGAAFSPLGMNVGDELFFFNAETLTPTANSQAVNLTNPSLGDAGGQFQILVNLHFASAPTSFTFTVQGAMDDVTTSYLQIGTIATGTATDYQVQISCSTPYVRAQVSAQSGGGAVTSKIYRVS